MNTKLGQRFKLIRTRAGFTQAQVAYYLGVDQSYISKFEKNERQLNLNQLSKAGLLFGCPLKVMINPDIPIETLPLAMRANGISDEDLPVIALINKLALNQLFMEELLEGELNEK